MRATRHTDTHAIPAVIEPNGDAGAKLAVFEHPADAFHGGEPAERHDRLADAPNGIFQGVEWILGRAGQTRWCWAGDLRQVKDRKNVVIPTRQDEPPEQSPLANVFEIHEQAVVVYCFDHVPVAELTVVDPRANVEGCGELRAVLVEVV